MSPLQNHLCLNDGKFSECFVSWSRGSLLYLSPSATFRTQICGIAAILSPQYEMGYGYWVPTWHWSITLSVNLDFPHYWYTGT